MNKADVAGILDRIYEYVSCICANCDAKGGTMSKNAYATRTRLPNECFTDVKPLLRETMSTAS